MNETTERRGRGRPKGSTRYAQEDAAIVRRAADFMICDDKLSPTAAIKRATGRPSDETLTHRLRGKMKPNIDMLLSDARARSKERMHSPAGLATPPSRTPELLGSIFDRSTRSVEGLSSLARSVEELNSFARSVEGLSHFMQPFQEHERFMDRFMQPFQETRPLYGPLHAALSETRPLQVVEFGDGWTIMTVARLSLQERPSLPFSGAAELEFPQLTRRLPMSDFP